MKFTAHNVSLPNGGRTINESEVTLAESNVWKAILKSLELFLPQDRNDWTKLRVADLGCLEGGYALEFAKLGFQTVGIEAREDNLEKCYFLKDIFSLSNLEFYKDDVRNISKYGQFDIILNYGLLYHLNDPVSFLKVMSSCNTSLLFLNTHFAPERDYRYKLGPVNRFFIAPLQKRTHILETTQNYRLSRITLNEGFRGRWYKEWNPNISSKRVEKMSWASYNNDKSFWLCKKDLTKALELAGYKHVFEQFDYTGDIMKDNYTDFYNRTMFVCLK